MTDTASTALITAGASLIVALISGGITWRNRRKTTENSVEIEVLKGSVNRDLERLKAKLLHGQIISSTQWNAEFSAYQAIWKGMVAVRTLANKIVFRESELIDYGVPLGHLPSADRIKMRQELVSKFGEAAQTLLFAIHDNAPFYPAPIRQVANNTHCKVKALIEKHLAALATYFINGTNTTKEAGFIADSTAILGLINGGVDLLESLIRERLAAVEVVNDARV